MVTNLVLYSILIQILIFFLSIQIISQNKFLKVTEIHFRSLCYESQILSNTNF